MSVVSSRISSVSSMLKDSGVRAQFIKQPKICTLPKNVKDILYNYKGIRKKEYDKLVHSIKNGVVKVMTETKDAKKICQSYNA